jgi:hypothetical protein
MAAIRETLEKMMLNTDDGNGVKTDVTKPGAAPSQG